MELLKPRFKDKFKKPLCLKEIELSEIKPMKMPKTTVVNQNVLNEQQIINKPIYNFFGHKKVPE